MQRCARRGSLSPCLGYTQEYLTLGPHGQVAPASLSMALAIFGSYY